MPTAIRGITFSTPTIGTSAMGRINPVPKPETPPIRDAKNATAAITTASYRPTFPNCNPLYSPDRVWHD
jgi:hypothetical protein